MNSHYKHAQTQALKRGIHWDLQEAAYLKLVKKRCFYCSSKLAIKGVRLDRVTNELGYSLDNVVPCCGKCNIMKGSLNKDVFISHIHRILINLTIKYPNNTALVELGLKRLKVSNFPPIFNDINNLLK